MGQLLHTAEVAIAGRLLCGGSGGASCFKECCQNVVPKSVAKECCQKVLPKSVAEKCCRKVLPNSVAE